VLGIGVALLEIEAAAQWQQQQRQAASITEYGGDGGLVPSGLDLVWRCPFPKEASIQSDLMRLLLWSGSADDVAHHFVMAGSQVL
jgi:hypothetical protein